MEYSVTNARKVGVNRRLLYLLVFLFVAIPVVVGVLVWYFMPKCEDRVEVSTSPPDHTVVTTPGTAVPSDAEPWKNLRLPQNVKPVHYDITLFPNFYGDSGVFYGNETIEMTITEETKFILIHIKYLNISKTELWDNNTKADIPIKRKFNYDKHEFYVIETVNPIRGGSVVSVHLQFDGSLTRSIVGFYKSTYKNSITGETRHLATSKFEPVAARRAFPCFDEPNIKAQYTIRLVHRDDYRALSNMPEMSTVDWEHDVTFKVTDFQRSVKMSTYLVCFIVCDFEYLERTTKYNTKVRVFATPDRVNLTRYALEMAVHAMELYQETFDVEYPLPKQDMIAIPDFVSGAMEHWGLITYRETNILYDENEASSANKQRVAVVIAHEISHQWFGNIVTMDWWDDLWLNEGFASYMEYIGVDPFEPTWEMMSQFVSEDILPVMITDAGVTSHPIVVDVTDPAQINAVFDSISYSKGASVIGMLQYVMGRDEFFAGIGRYLKKFAWGNAKTDDLWQELGTLGQGSEQRSVKQVMDTWTRQMGLPYINITFQGGEVVAYQKRFLADSSTPYDESESEFRYTWYVPLDYITSDGPTSTSMKWMERASVRFDSPIDHTDSSKWIKFNVNQTGFYRVLYPDLMWRRFATMLQNQGPEVLSTADRTGLVSDAFNLARGGYLDYSVALEIMLYLDQETSHQVWDTASSGIEYIGQMFQFGGDFGPWRKFVLSKVKPVLERIGWDDTGSHLQKMMRSHLIDLTCGYGDTDCLNNATQRFQSWIQTNQVVPPNLRSLVYKFGMKTRGTSENWNKMWDIYMKETVPQERVKLMYGLAQTTEVWLLIRYLNYCKNETKIRSQDIWSVISYIAKNPTGRSLAWDWAQQNWEYLVDRFGLYSRYFGRMIPALVSNFNKQFELEQVEQFFAKYPDAGAGENGRKQALESIKRNIKWIQKYEEPIINWLSSRV